MNAPLRQLEHRWTYDHRIADCSNCPLVSRRDETECLSQRPTSFNGLMVLGEGPGANEARLKVPFCGRSGALLDELLKRVGIEREHCYVSNATLCCPPIMNDKEKSKALAKAVPACRPRLLAEIEMLQPRVILAFGGPALSTLTGRLVPKMVKVPLFRDAIGQPLNCPQCDGEKTLAWWKCSNCKDENLLPPRWDAWCGKEVEGQFWCAEAIDARDTAESPCRTTPFASVKVASRKKRCPTCLGRKSEKIEIPEWKTDHKISAVAGALYRGRYAPDYEVMDPEARVDLPCRYVIPTWHPAFLLRQPEGKQKKTAAGQFLINASLAHLEKAARLLTEDAKWTYTYHVVPDHLVRDVAHLPEDAPERRHATAQALGESLEIIRAYLYADPTPMMTAADIETDGKNPFEVTDIRCVGFHHVHATDAATQEQQTLIVNTSGLMKGHPIVDLLTDWFRDPTRTKCFQNGIFDVQTLEFLWGV